MDGYGAMTTPESTVSHDNRIRGTYHCGVADARSHPPAGVGYHTPRVLRTILSGAIVVTLLTSAAILVRLGGRRIEGPMPLSLLGFMALLFTPGLDVGLIMMPLTEFPRYAREPVYAFANPLAIAFGFWGFLVWGFYFLTTFYFLAVEPHVGCSRSRREADQQRGHHRHVRVHGAPPAAQPAVLCAVDWRAAALPASWPRRC